MPSVTRTVGAGLACLFAAAALAQPALPPNRGTRPEQPVLDRVQLERRLAAVGFLLEKSSAARQIEASGDAGAQERRAQALERHRQAQEAFKADDLAATARLLSEASVLIMEGARRAAPAQINGVKERSDFDARMASVKALLAANRRVIAEKNGAPEAAQTSGTIENMVDAATQLAAAGKLPEGRALLDQAYVAAKAAIASIRSGDTLTRSVHFASKEEEYQYELERYNTHRTLIQSLLAQQRDAPDASLKELIDNATRLRGAAERAAAAGDHAAAVTQFEESTRELLRAIRSLGISVPG